MRCVSRSFGFAIVSLGLMGLIGCGEDNEKSVLSESNGKTTAAPVTAQDYGKMAPKGGGPGGLPGNYPGANKAVQGGAPK